MNWKTIVIAVTVVSFSAWGDDNEQLINASPYSASGYSGIKLIHVEGNEVSSPATAGGNAGKYSSTFGIGVSSSGWQIAFGGYPGAGSYVTSNFTLGYYTTDHLMQKFTDSAISSGLWNTSNPSHYLQKSTFDQAVFTASAQLNVLPIVLAAGVKGLPFPINPFVGIGFSSNVLWGTAGQYFDSLGDSGDTLGIAYHNTGVACMELGYVIPFGVTVFPFQPLHNEFLSKIGVTLGYAYHRLWTIPFWDPSVDITVPKKVGFGTQDNIKEVYFRLELAY